MNPPSDNTTPGPPPSRTIKTPFGRPTRVSTVTFVNTLLPPLPVSLDLGKFINSVKRFKSPSKQIVTRSGRLRGYNKANPSQLSHDCAFKHLHTCASKLVKALSAYKPHFAFVQNEKSKPGEDNGLPDAYVCPIGESHIVDGLDWSSIAVSAVYQRESTGSAAEKVRRSSRIHMSSLNSPFRISLRSLNACQRAFYVTPDADSPTVLRSRTTICSYGTATERG